jgi:hypothetical protein
VALARSHMHHPERLRQQLEVVGGPHPPEHHIPLDPDGLRGRGNRPLLLDLLGRIVFHTA